MSSVLTLASYNIHSGIGTDGRFDLERIASVLLETGAEVIALQEVGDFRGRTERCDHPEVLAERLGMHLAFGPNVVKQGRRYGNAILTARRILRSQNYDLSVRHREPRGALRCDLDLGGSRQLHVFCLHLGLSVRERRTQEALLLSSDILRDAVRTEPVLVCGDFNYWFDGPVRSMVRREIRDAALLSGQRMKTYPSRMPLLRLDRIYVDGGVRVISVRPHRSALSKVASDHLPLVMTFEALVSVQINPEPSAELIR